MDKSDMMSVAAVHIFRPHPTTMQGMRLGIDWKVGEKAMHPLLNRSDQVTEILHVPGTDSVLVLFKDGPEVEYVGSPLTVMFAKQVEVET